jgi:hypothetical protein
LLKEQAGDIASGSREARDVTERQRVIVDRKHHDRQGVCRCHGGFQGDLRVGGNDDIDVAQDQFGLRFDVSIELLLRVRKLDDEVLLLDVAEVPWLGSGDRVGVAIRCQACFPRTAKFQMALGPDGGAG